MEHFEEKFHSIKGNSIGDHKRLFNLFVRELESEGAKRIAQFLNCVTPKNRQEKNFHLKLLLKHGFTTNLRTILMQGDIISNKIIIKHANINQLLHDCSGNDFILDICPRISYVTRIGLINKLSQSITDEARGQEYFTAIHDKYGFKIASSLLISCGEKFVKNKITGNNIHLTDRQLIKLHRYDGFLQFYFKEKFSFSSYQRLGRYLVKNNIEIFWELLQYGDPKIGKRGCEKIFKTYTNEITENSDKYKRYIKSKLAIKYLTRDNYIMLFRNMFPKSAIHFNLYTGLEKYLKSLPKKERMDTILNLFKEVYGFELNLKDYDLKHMFTIEDQRRITPDFDSYNIELIKDKITLTTDMKTRSDLLVKLVQTCKLREDNDGLLEVLKYFLARHKNENVEVRRQFLDEIREFPLHELGDEYWDILKQLLNVFDINGEYFDGIIPYMISLLRKNIELELDFTDTLQKCFQVKGVYGAFLDFFDNEPKLEKIVLFRVPEYLDKFTEQRSHLVSSFIYKLVDFNKKHPKHFISYYKFPNYLKEYIKNTEINSYSYLYSTLIMTMLKYIPKEDEDKVVRDQIINTLLDNSETCENQIMAYKNDMMMWLLRTRIDLLEKHLDLFFKQERPERRFIYEISKMHYHPVYEKFLKLALHALVSDDVRQICLGLEGLSFDDDYMSLVDKYKPVGVNINPDEEDMEELLEKQTTILRCLNNRSKPEESIEFVLSFCYRDYLRPVHGALYFTLYNTREEVLEKPLTELFTRSVPIRKQTIFLATTLSGMEYTKQLLMNLIQNEMNRSLRQFILKRTFKFLCQENSEIFWQLLKTHIIHMNNIEMIDSESLWILMSFRKMPQNYLQEYIPMVWNYAKKCKDQKFHFLILLTPEMLKLCPEIGEVIIKDTIFVHNWDLFVCKYLFSNCKGLEKQYDFIFGCLKNAVVKINVKSALKNIYNLFSFICKKLIDDKVNNASIHLTMLKIHLENLNIIFNKLQYELLLAFVEAYLSKTVDKNQFVAEYITQQQIELRQKYGLDILKFYTGCVTKFIEMIYGIKYEDNFKNIVDIIERILLIDSSDGTLLLILELMPTKATRDVELIRHREDVIGKIQKSSSNLVQIYLINCLINMEE